MTLGAEIDLQLITAAGTDNNLVELNNLLRQGANPTTTQNSPLRWAVFYGNEAIVNRLLELPEVVAQITAFDNSAYRFARSMGHERIASRLWQFDAVRNYSSATQIRNVPISRPQSDALRDIATNRESSMRALSNEQRGAVSVLTKRYQRDLVQKGVPGILSSLERYLMDQYEKNPVILNGQKQPITYNPTLSNIEQQKYLLDPTHTVYRYLFLEQNPWMHSQAAYIQRNRLGTKAHINEEDKQTIAILWSALQDPSFPLPEGYTRESLVELFIRDLSLIARAHNWDKTRRNSVGRLEEYDDNERDRPSCNVGVSQRLTASTERLITNLDPALRTLTENIIKNEFRAMLIAEGSPVSLFKRFNEENSLEKLKALRTAIDSLVVDNFGNKDDLEENNKNIIDGLQIDKDNVEKFIQFCNDKFTSDRITKPASKKPRWEEKSFNTYKELIQHISANAIAIFYNELKEKLDQRISPLEKEKQAREAQAREAREREAQMSAARREAQIREAQIREAQGREAREREAQMREALARAAREREAQMRAARREAQIREALASATRAREAQVREARERAARVRESQAREALAREMRESQVRESQAREALARKTQARQDEENLLLRIEAAKARIRAAELRIARVREFQIREEQAGKVKTSAAVAQMEAQPSKKRKTNEDENPMVKKQNTTSSVVTCMFNSAQELFRRCKRASKQSFRVGGTYKDGVRRSSRLTG